MSDFAKDKDDIISRRAAIDAVEKESQVDGAYGYMDTKSIIDLLNDLPPAKPQRYMVTMAESTDLDRLKGIITKPSDITLIPLPKAEPRWIPCSERLPERGVSVLVSHVGYVSEDYLDVDDGAMYFWNSGIDLDEELNNLAWQPLPEPWKGGEDGRA